MNKIDFNQYTIEFSELDSTNSYLKKKHNLLPNFTIVKADYQTFGYGQFGRQWESNKGENLLFSILLKGNLPFEVKDTSPVFVASIITTLEDYGIKANFIYPNDIFVDEKKIAGILIETKYSGLNLDYIIIGIGLNVNQENFTTPEAISMKKIKGIDFDREELFSKLLNNLSNSVLLSNLMYLVRYNEKE